MDPKTARQKAVEEQGIPKMSSQVKLFTNLQREKRYLTIERPRGYHVNKGIKLSLAQTRPPDIMAHEPPDGMQ